MEQVDYGAGVVLSALLPEARAAEFILRVGEAFAGTVTPAETGERFQDVPLRAPVTQ